MTYVIPEHGVQDSRASSAAADDHGETGHAHEQPSLEPAKELRRTLNASQRESLSLCHSLRQAQESFGTTVSLDEVITDAPPPARAMALGSQDMYTSCRRLLGSAFPAAYAHCRARYGEPECDMARVQRELLAMVSGLPDSEKKNAIGQLEMLVFNEVLRR